MKKRIVITAGGTVENIDGVRQITNFSTGGLGCEICETLLKDFYEHIEEIIYVCPKHAKQPPLSDFVRVYHVTDVGSVFAKVQDILNRKTVDIFVHSMAVSDYSLDYVSGARMLAEEIVRRMEERDSVNISPEDKVNGVLEVLLDPQTRLSTGHKLSSSEKELFIHLKQAPKVIRSIKEMQPRLFLVGFKLLRHVSGEQLLKAAGDVMQRNRCDLVVANDLRDITANDHKAMIVHKGDFVEHASTKKEIAQMVCDACFRTAN